MSLLFALVIMALVVVPLISWVARADKRRRLEAGGPPGTEKEEVA